ncbi:MAG: hypothetical protein CSA81_05555 [Acidobacteria bacterium]|nr:MAG: hypothetical protein CSA81_05555 [Acidobacteriota bacterium]PIE90945.1 MAG: hypothetical protein CR997_03555 [Acidobacteriota bacterium]
MLTGNKSITVRLEKLVTDQEKKLSQAQFSIERFKPGCVSSEWHTAGERPLAFQLRLSYKNRTYDSICYHFLSNKDGMYTSRTREMPFVFIQERAFRLPALSV